MSPSSPTIAVARNPAERLETLPSGLPERTLGDAVTTWAHRWLIQPNGPRARKPFRLTFDQWRFLQWWYAVDADGQWLFQHGARRLAKGSGKSPFAAVLALIEFLGPCRLERFDDRRPGGCRGRPVDMPLVQIAATAESQTANTMRMVRAFAPKGSPIVAEYNLDPGKTRYYRVPEGTLEVITSSPTAAEGAEASFVVKDETEHWKPTNGGPELAATIDDNLAKSGARGIETSNAWVPGQDTVAEATWDAWVAQEEGRTRESAILYDARIAAPDTDLSDPASLIPALEWVYGDCDWKRPKPDAQPDVRPIVTRIWRLDAKVDDSKRKYLNWPTVAVDAWTTPQAWAQLADTEKSIDPADDVVLFFDGSKSRDATALIGCRVSDGHVFVVDIWEPDPTHSTASVVPVQEIDLTVQRAFDRLSVVAFFSDVAEWESFTKVEWPTRYAEQLAIKAVSAGKDPQAIAWDMRSHVLEFTRAVELVEGEITEQTFTHDGDPRLHRHVVNCRRRLNRWGVSIGKESPNSPKKVDAGVAMVGARMVRRLVLAAAPQSKRSGVVV